MTVALPRLEQLAAEWSLPAGAAGRLDALLALLATDPTAPSAITEADVAAGVHVEDSLTALVLPQVRGAKRIADLGAGAGFPGLVLAVALPSAQVALVESAGRKAEFIGRMAAAAGLANARSIRARAEAWTEGLGAHDLVTARALGPLAVLVEYAAPLLAPGGTLVAWKGRRDHQEEADGDAAAAELGLAPAPIHGCAPRPGADSRYLHLYSKVSDTPAKYPRRAGMARKRPVQASGRA